MLKKTGDTPQYDEKIQQTMNHGHNSDVQSQITAPGISTKKCFTLRCFSAFKYSLRTM